MTTITELSDIQKKIVNYPNAPIYVKACAGSGKTRILTERIRALLSLTNKNILALTFTNKAGEEIKDRLSDIQNIEKKVFIGTFHSFCQSILENHGHLIGLKQMPHIFEDENDRAEILKQAVNQTPEFLEYFSQNQFQQLSTQKILNIILSSISSTKRKLETLDEEDSVSQNPYFEILYNNYQAILENQNAIDFDDIILLSYKLLISYPHIAKLYQRSFFSICIDEAQDLNNAQYQFLLALTEKEFTNILMVGDPNQSIFHFNGSSPDFMNIKFVQDFSPIIFTINENYRSAKAILLNTQKIFHTDEEITETVKQGLFEIHNFSDEISEAEWVINRINELLKLQYHQDIEGAIRPEKIAILARNKYLFKQIEGNLQKNELPYYYKISTGPIIYESDQMKVFDLAFRIKLNPSDTLHKNRLVKKLKLEQENVQSLQDILDLIEDCFYKDVINVVNNLDDSGKNFIFEINALIDKLKTNIDESNNLIINDLNELLDHWKNYAKIKTIKSLKQFRNEMSLGRTQSIMSQNGITLSTIHSMKGQEYDIVFLIGMDDGTFPDYRAITKNGIEIEQEKNNLYVAFSRARRFLFVTWPKNRQMPWGDIKPRFISRFLAPINKMD